MANQDLAPDTSSDRLINGGASEHGSTGPSLTCIRGALIFSPVAWPVICTLPNSAACNRLVQSKPPCT